MTEDFDLSSWLEDSDEGFGFEPPSVVSTRQPEPSSELALTPNEVRILNYCEQVFWETGLLPTVEKIAEELTGTQGGRLTTFIIYRAMKNPLLIQQLSTRGIDFTPGTTSKVLSPKQIVVANRMLNLHDKRSEREKLQECGVSSQQYHAWLRQPQFVEFIRRRGEALFKSTDAAAYQALVRNVKAGDNASLKLFFEMRGIYTPKLDININIEAVLTRVIEVIQQHVKDPDALTAIAGELEVIAEEVG